MNTCGETNPESGILWSDASAEKVKPVRPQELNIGDGEMMTNQEYESASIEAAGVFDMFKESHKLAQIEAHIALTEDTLARLQEMRREIINRNNLNKGGSNEN